MQFSKIMLSVLTVLFLTNKASAQLFEKRELYPNIKTITGKYYNGTGGGGYWSIAKLDTVGRIIEEESYRKRKLLSRQNFVYNFNNDKLYQIQTFDINNPNRKNDTIFCYEYKYQKGRIVYQKLTYGHSKQDSIVTRLIENKDDTTLIYQQKSYHFWSKIDVTDVYERNYILNYKNELLISIEIFNIDDNSKEITYYEYYPNGKQKRKKVEREPEQDMVYVGGLGSDDMFYEYKFDKSGRTKKLYYIIERKKYKIVTYRYCQE